MAKLNKKNHFLQVVVKNFLSQEFNLQVIPYSLYLAPLFIPGPFRGGGLIGEGGLIDRGAFLFI